MTNMHGHGRWRKPVAEFSAQAENFDTDRRGAWNARIIAHRNVFWDKALKSGKIRVPVLDLIFRIMDNTSPCETSLVRMVN